MQRDTALFVLLFTRQLGTAQTAGAVDLDSIDAHLHRSLDGALHRAAETDPAFQLLRDAFGDQLRVRFRAADFDDLGEDFLARNELGDLRTERVELGALLADQKPRTRRGDNDPHPVREPLDLDSRNRRGGELLLDELADRKVLMEPLAKQILAAERLARKPTGFPIFGEGCSQSDRINFLSHDSIPYTLVIRQNNFQMAGPLADPARRAARLRTETLDDRTGGDQRRLDGQLLPVHIQVVLSIGHGGAQGVAEQTGRFARAQFDDRERLNCGLPLDQAGHVPRLFRTDPHIPCQSSYFHNLVLEFSGTDGLRRFVPYCH